MKLANFLIFFLPVLALISLGYFLGKRPLELPIVLYEAPSDDANLVQWQKDPKLAGDSLVKVTVVASTRTEMYVYVDYINSASHEEKTAACGAASASDPDKFGRGWSCAPTGLARGRGFVTLRTTTLAKQGEVACSDGFQIMFYGRGGIPYLNKTFPFKKIWVGGENGFYGKLLELFAACP